MFTKKYINLTELNRIMIDYIREYPWATKDNNDNKVRIRRVLKGTRKIKDFNTGGLVYLVDKDGSMKLIKRTKNSPTTLWQDN